MPKARKKVTPAETNVTPIAEVVWIDAIEIGDIGWNDLKDIIKEARKPCPTMRSVGYVIYHCDTHISLLSTIGGEECSRLEKIPVQFIQSIEYIRGVAPIG
jgi:hypothetical protein